MKRFLLATLLTACTGMAHADAPRLVNADGSELSAICIAAVSSRETMYARAAEFGLRNFEPGEMRCNGQTLARFISTQRAAMARAAAEPAGYVFTKSDETPVTELCLAAVRSEQEYRSVKARHFADEANIEAEVRCNGMPVLNFARKYRTALPTISLR